MLDVSTIIVQVRKFRCESLNKSIERRAAAVAGNGRRKRSGSILVVHNLKQAASVWVLYCTLRHTVFTTFRNNVQWASLARTTVGPNTFFNDREGMWACGRGSDELLMLSITIEASLLPTLKGSVGGIGADCEWNERGENEFASKEDRCGRISVPRNWWAIGRRRYRKVSWWAATTELKKFAWAEEVKSHTGTSISSASTLLSANAGALVLHTSLARWYVREERKQKGDNGIDTDEHYPTRNQKKITDMKPPPPPRAPRKRVSCC